MKKNLVYLGMIFFVVSLTGCASLGRLASDIQEIDATQEIGAVSTLTADVVNSPWDNIVQVGIGYLLALIRRKYKKSKGAK